MSGEARRGRRIYEDVAARLAEKIHNGEFPNGSLLPSERELVELFSVSRTSIREALLSLQSSGLITLRASARARVTTLGNAEFMNQLAGAAQSLLKSSNGVADFQEARMFFECSLARYAARHASSKEIDRLGMALARNKQALGDPALFAETDLAFHNILAEIPRNPIFVALNASLAEWLAQQRTVGLQSPAGRPSELAYQGHEAVYEAIAAHDPEAADKAMSSHLEAVSRIYWQAVASEMETVAR